MTRSTGTTTWLDLSAQDLSAVMPFYSGLFGWEVEGLGEEFGGYRILRNDGKLVGGAMSVAGMTCPEGSPLPSEWGVYLTVDDVDARVARAREAGGGVVVPADDIGDSGRMAVVLDSVGAPIGMWQPKQLEGYEFTGRPGSPVWFELMTHRYDDAAAFYTAVFDAELTPMDEGMDEDGDGFRYATNGSAESASWGLCDAAGMMPEEAMGWRVYFGVESTEQALAKVRELGGSVLDGPIDSPFGRITTIADPEGASFQISAMGEAISEG
ncbi:VOC family protein [Brachybacterium paraconglomeratum]